MISLATADIPLKAYLNIFDCLRRKRIGKGSYVSKFEDALKEYFGTKHAIVCSSGTMADFLMLRALKEMNPSKSEVIVPAFTFIAQVNAVIWAGLKPLFVDVSDDFQMSRDQTWYALAESDDILCAFPAHLMGKFCPVVSMKNVNILEDCCEAMGGSYGAKFGTFGIAGAFSMFPSHTITTGEGGVVITNDTDFAKIVRSVMNHGKWNTQDFDFEYLGINAKMTDLQASIGLTLVNQIDEVNEKRQRNISLYNRLLSLNFETQAPHCYPVIYETKEKRDYALMFLKEFDVECRKLMGCIPESKPYWIKYSDSGVFLNASKFANCGLMLPVHQNLKEEEIRYICDVLPRP